ncbi:hypothetical protein FOA52_013494 [Chlamydomonas sp. UWO 241]|nr:hypothetical protein FOA52_013494 [Chlamydomonas sp. UWO 241]
MQESKEGHVNLPAASSSSSPAGKESLPCTAGETVGVSSFWLRLNCLAFWLLAVVPFYRGWDLKAVVVLCYTSMYPAHWLLALSSRGGSSGSSNKWLMAALRWLFVDHVCVMLHVLRNALYLFLTALECNAGWSAPSDGLILATCYGALAALNEPYDLSTALVVSGAVLLPRAAMQVVVLSRREELSLVTIVVFPLLHACTLATIRIAAARCRAARVQPLQWLLARAQALWTARNDPPADRAAEAPGGSHTCAPLLSAPVATAAPQAPASATTHFPVTAAMEAMTSFATPAAGGAQGAAGDGGLPRYSSGMAGNASVTFVTKFPSLHLSQHPQLSTSEGVAALQGRLERKACEVLSRMRGEPVAVRLTQFYIGAGCVVVSGRWDVHGFAGGMSEQEMRALVEDVMMEEMLQEVDPTPEGMRTPCSILDNHILDSSSEMRQLDLDNDDESQPATTLHVETGQHTRVPLPSMAGVPLLAVTTPWQALPLHDGGNNRVHLQFATPLLAHALGRDPELVVSFAPAGGASAPAPHASLSRARICDLQAAARARGNPPGLMDVDIDLRAHASTARDYGGMLIAQLVDGPTMLAAVPVPLLPCAAQPAAAELSRVGLDLRNALHIARDLGLLLLAPHPTGELSPAHRALMRNAAQQLKQWAQQEQNHLPATLALLDSVEAKLDAVDAPPRPASRRSVPHAAVVAAHGETDGAPADRESGCSTSVTQPAGTNASAAAHTGPTTLWCWINVFLALVALARGAFADGLGHAFHRGATSCFMFALPFIMILVMRARPTLLARLPRWLAHADSSLLRRGYNLLFNVVSAQAVGHISPGVCNLVRTGMGIPLMGLFDLVEPLDVRAWWARAALAVVLLVPAQVVVMCSCSGQDGTESMCTRHAWADLAAFVAPRVAMPFVVNAAIWWMSGRARRGDKPKRE